MIIYRDKPDLKRFTIDLSLEQHRKLRLIALQNNKTMRDMIREFIDTLPEPSDREDYVYQRIYK